MLDNFSIWMVREGMNPPMYARFYEIFLEKVYCHLFFFPHVLISFFLAYASVFLCATRVTDLECICQKQQLHNHLLQDQENNYVFRPLQLRLSALLAVVPVTWTCAHQETHSPTHFTQLNKQLLIIACNPADMRLNETPDFSHKAHLCVNVF